MKVEIIEGCNYLSREARGRGVQYLEEKTNAFLDNNPDIKIHHIKQSSSNDGDSDGFIATTIISIWYEEV